MATAYKFGGSKNPTDGTSRLILKGSSTNPERYVDVGDSIELSDEEVESLRKSWKFTKVGESEEPSGDSSGSATPETPQDQQRQQSGIPPAPPTGDNADDNPSGGKPGRK